jgi:hypothetical protein
MNVHSNAFSLSTIFAICILGSVAIAQNSRSSAIEVFEKAKIEHELEIRKLALEAISKSMPSINRFAQKQDNANAQKFCKMLEAFAASGNYPAHLIPLPTVAAEFIEKRRASAERVQDAYNDLEDSAKQEVRNDIDLEKMQQEMDNFIENEKELQSLKPTATNPKQRADRNKNDLSTTERLPESKDGAKEAQKKLPEDTDKVFKAYAELADKIREELTNQETTALLQKAQQNARRRISDFWRNQQLTFLCEVADLSGTSANNLYELEFHLIEKENQISQLPISRLFSRVQIETPESKLEEIKPGRRFRLRVNVDSSFDRSIVDKEKIVSFLQVNSPKVKIDFYLYVTSVSIEWFD